MDSNNKKKKKKLENGELFIKINDIKHWCKIAGIEHNTTPLIIIHGGPGGHNYTFERTIGPLLEKFTTIIYYEQRGCGRSEGPEDKEAYSIPILISDLAELCNKLKLEKIIPLGFSFGGQLALEFALAYPNLVEKIVVQAPSEFYDNNRNYYVQLFGFEQIAEGNDKNKIKKIINTQKKIIEKWVEIWDSVDIETVNKFLFRNNESANKVRKSWRESGLENSGLMFKALKKKRNEIRLMERVSQIKAPTLIMTGLYDRNVGIELSRDFACKIPNSKLVIFEKSAHFPDIEEPEKYAKIVKEFIF
ncbi:MAG: alpha/beta fold hydrolase [Promethearchaeota archaeon]